jgi:general secretion pathway protein B
MSLILEALKKAEQQHRVGEVPKIGSQPVQTEAGTPIWAGTLLLGLFALAMVGVGLYLGQDSPQDEPESYALENSEAESVPAPVGVAKAVSSPPTPPISAEQVQQVAKAEAPPAMVQPIPAAPPSAIAEPEVGLEKPRRTSKPPAPPSSLAELPEGFVDNLPQLNIDIHSYDAKPGKSYVLINLEKYREGDYLAEGPLLSEILPDGVVLEHLGERFILPIGNN